MKRKLLPILLLLGWVFPGVFTHVFYQLERDGAYSEFTNTKNNVPAEEIKTVVFPIQSIIPWEKEGEEFMWNGRLYDVIRIEKTESDIVIKCIADSEDDYIVHNYINNNDLDQKNKKEKNGIPKLKEIKFLPIQISMFTAPVNRGPKGRISLRTDFLNPTIEIASPPPWLYFASPNA